MSGGLVDKAALLAPRAATESGMPEDTVEVPGFGLMRVRGLNRYEVMEIQKLSNPVEREQHMVAIAAIEPTFSRSEVKAWQKLSNANELEPVTTMIGRLSGMLEGAQKSKGQGIPS